MRPESIKFSLRHHFSLGCCLVQRLELRVQAAPFLVNILDVLPQLHDLLATLPNRVRALVHLLPNSRSNPRAT